MRRVVLPLTVMLGICLLGLMWWPRATQPSVATSSDGLRDLGRLTIDSPSEDPAESGPQREAPPETTHYRLLILDEVGMPIPAAQVGHVRGERYRTAAAVAVAASDSSGVMALPQDVVDEPDAFAIWKDGFESSAVPSVLLPGTTTVVLAPGEELQLRFLMQGERPLSGVTAIVSQFSPPRFKWGQRADDYTSPGLSPKTAIYKATSGADGVLRFSGLSRGTYAVSLPDWVILLSPTSLDTVEAPSNGPVDVLVDEIVGYAMEFRGGSVMSVTCTGASLPGSGAHRRHIERSLERFRCKYPLALPVFTAAGATSGRPLSFSISRTDGSLARFERVPVRIDELRAPEIVTVEDVAPSPTLGHCRLVVVEPHGPVADGFPACGLRRVARDGERIPREVLRWRLGIEPYEVRLIPAGSYEVVIADPLLRSIARGGQVEVRGGDECDFTVTLTDCV